MSCPTVDQANKQNFVVNIGDSEFVNLVVRCREQDKNYLLGKERGPYYLELIE